MQILLTLSCNIDSNTKKVDRSTFFLLSVMAAGFIKPVMQALPSALGVTGDAPLVLTGGGTNAPYWGTCNISHRTSRTPNDANDTNDAKIVCALTTFGVSPTPKIAYD